MSDVGGRNISIAIVERDVTIEGVSFGMFLVKR
jgi:hypothetical protein